ncbi:MAG: FAD-dependent monooxygenase [Candidatus Helarchaeota archaeon]
MYDVIIVGAGPAGSLLAKKLADADLKVLVVEQKKLPRHKMCSGLISSFSRRILKKEIGDIPPVICCHPKIIKGIQVYPTRTQPPQKFREKSHNVWRNIFDFWLTIKASEAGAEIWDYTEVISFSEKKDHIEVGLKGASSTQKQETRFLIGADGGLSFVRKKLYPNLQMRWFQPYQTYWEGTIDLDPEYFYSFLDPEFTEFFAWFNVKTGHKGKYLVVGTAAEQGKTIPQYFNAFQEYLEEAFGFKGEKLLYREACIAPVFFDTTSQFKYLFGKGNILLIGEAALLYNIFAEGISPALTSAVQAADAILQEETPVLEKYKENIQPLCRNLKVAWNSTFEIFPHFLSQVKEKG